MAAPLRVAARGILRAICPELTLSEVNTQADRFEDAKDAPQPLLGGKSWRQVLIAVSENLIKAQFGQGFFGEALVRELETRVRRDKMERFVVTDTGFNIEVKPIAERFACGAGVRVVTLVRPGVAETFDGDSREWLTEEGCGLCVERVVNESMEGLAEVAREYAEWLDR